MTLLYAEKLDDLIYVFADTFWTQPLLSESPKWPLAPLVKLVSPKLGTIVGYAGDSELAEAALRKLCVEQTGSVESILLCAHLESRICGREVEFLVASVEPWTLIEIKEGSARSVATTFLGSKANFSKFQALRHGESFQESNETFMRANTLPTQASDSSRSRYSAAIGAFKSVLREPVDMECGGFCVAYTLSADGCSFMGYLDNSRGNIADGELPVGRWSTVPSNDVYNGGSLLIFGGSEQKFFAHYVNGNFAFVHDNFPTQGLTTQKITGRDPHDIEYELHQLGLSHCMTNWSDPRAKAAKIRQLVEANEFDQAEYAINASGELLANRLSTRGSVGKLNFSEGYLNSILDQESISGTLDEIWHLGFLIQSRYVMYSRMGDRVATLRAKSEWDTWQELASSVPLELQSSKVRQSIEVPEQDK